MLTNTNGMIVDLLNQVDHISNQFVLQGYQNLVATYSPAIFGLIALSVIVFGYATLQGLVQLSFEDVLKKALLIGFILALAMNWGNFSSYVYNVFTQTPNEIASHVMSAIPNVSFSNATSGNDRKLFNLPVVEEAA